MILDTLPNFHRYLPVHRLFPIVSEFIYGRDLMSLDTGKHTIGHGITASIDEYVTRPPEDRLLECHRRFIDVQILLSGRETIGLCPTSRCHSGLPYNEEKDCERVSGPMDFVTFLENDIAVFFPHDAHLPGTTRGGISEPVRKMVVKVPVIS